MAFMSRFQHIEFEHDLDDWCRWALQANLPIEVIAFLRFRSDMFYTFDPKSSEPTFACPRTWHMAAKAMQVGHGQDGEREAIIGSLGKSVGLEFVGFLQVWQKMPKLDYIIQNPETAEIPSDPATIYAVCGGLARKATDVNFGNIAKYAKRLTPEFGVFLVSSAARCKPNIQNTRSFIQWSADNSDVLV